MPKCPFCGSSQSNGGTLNNHILNRHREHSHSVEKPVDIVSERKNLRRTIKKYVVIDGNNVAYSMGNPPRIKYIKSARFFIKKKGYEPIIIISSALKYKVEDRLEITRMINMGWVVEAEPDRDDDRLVIDTAINKGCKIISNDRYLDHFEHYSNNSIDIKSLIVKFKIIDDKFSL